MQSKCRAISTENEEKEQEKKRGNKSKFKAGAEVREGKSSSSYICWVEFPFQVLLSSSSLSSSVRSLQILPSFLKSLGRISRFCLEGISLNRCTEAKVWTIAIT
ncbi:hypothetical protein CHARACLAT_031797 [Characodon lateralis]|uniref:Uncharacterized protein n=1 Tax=Characodon lateralis TaxID=208331 RepID=A0ABU7DVV2_9TELE|nr:hypothetical protein [Characodon lateralis]